MKTFKYAKEEGEEFELDSAYSLNQAYQALQIANVGSRKASKFSPDMKNLVSLALLVLNYQFLKPSKAAEQFMLTHTKLVMNFIQLILRNGDLFSIQMLFKWISSICRDNFAFLIDMPNYFIDFLFDVFKLSLSKEDWQITSMILDIFLILVLYRYKNIAENTTYICEKMMELKDQPQSMLNNLLSYYLPQKLMKLDIKKK
jgi:hypothetical protein